MFWITCVSFWRNKSKYALAMIGLTLAVLLSCLGLSALDMLKSATLKPLTFLVGGKILIADQRTEITTSVNMLYAEALNIKPYRSQLAEEIIEQVMPRTKMQYTLVAPYQFITRNNLPIWQYVFSRDNPAQSLSSLPILTGERIGNDEKRDSLLMAGPGITDSTKAWDGSSANTSRIVSVPMLTDLDGFYDWNASKLVSKSYYVKGTHDFQKTLYCVEWTDIKVLQSHIGGDRPVSWISVECPIKQMAEFKGKLEQAILSSGAPLQVMTIYDLGSLLLGDFSRLENMTEYYVPVMLFVAVLIVMVNAIALTMSRKKELALMRVLGMSRREVQTSFLAECTLTSFIGGVLGTLCASGLGIVLAKDPSVSLIPFMISLIATAVVSGISMLVLANGSLSQTIRNPMD